MHLSIFNAVLSIATGAVVGWWFFAGLWWTVRRLPTARHPVILAVGSYSLRMGAVVLVALALAQLHWSLPAFALVGLIAARQGMVAGNITAKPE